jgi:hypothetical protein
MAIEIGNDWLHLEMAIKNGRYLEPKEIADALRKDLPLPSLLVRNYIADRLEGKIKRLRRRPKKNAFDKFKDNLPMATLCEEIRRRKKEDGLKIPDAIEIVARENNVEMDKLHNFYHRGRNRWYK